ncbi:methionine-rich copper-binding protein CopC [Mycetocola sp. CAN_C7]|uniref:copper resistance CopC family protein n=1 Tax=Mycetocola sp. CAN_C7 TaxID=2787724 RepID=UPI0018CA4DBA
MKLRILIGLGGVAGVAMVAVLGLAPAQAHNSLVSTNPAAGAVVTEQVGTFAVTTSDLLLDSGTDSPTTFVQVSGPGESALYYGDGCATVDGATLTMPAQLGEAGEYTVNWGVVSADGHPITGDFAFTWAPAEGQELGEGFASAPTCGAEPTESQTPAPVTATPEEPTQTATTAPVGEEGTASASVSDIVWIGAALGVLVLAAIVVLVVVRSRGRSSAATDAGDDDTRVDPPAAR